MTPPLWVLVTIASLLFGIGAYGVLARRQIIIVLMGVEIMMAAGALLFCGFSRFHGDIGGQVMVMFVMGVAAAEAAVGLAILVLFQRRFGTVDSDDGRLLRG